eukprot:CAMPEP_0171463228 /NCGR_PEP_ID=MMETSP0945-20130129/6969_1 /TAXON_ID=109269 /ORGANISM="Vaucheria litorea, Strain CCMP2940" /LENGTH=175 /DNA_ID=CAMNT_0011989951 /DNA_START=66 /DNA_END=593 /DNA_ORIENTATION=+
MVYRSFQTIEPGQTEIIDTLKGSVKVFVFKYSEGDSAKNLKIYLRSMNLMKLLGLLLLGSNLVSSTAEIVAEQMVDAAISKFVLWALENKHDSLSPLKAIEKGVEWFVKNFTSAEDLEDEGNSRQYCVQWLLNTIGIITEPKFVSKFDSSGKLIVTHSRRFLYSSKNLAITLPEN